jgi:hypothetical protein
MPDIDYAAWRFWISVGMLLLNLCAWVWVFWDRKNRATNSRVCDVERRVETAEKDVIEIRAMVGFLPSQKSIDTLNQNISELKGRFDGVNRAVDLINQFLIEQGGKK